MSCQDFFEWDFPLDKFPTIVYTLFTEVRDMNAHKESAQIANEKFKSVGIGSLDSKNRITLRDKVMKEPPLDRMEIDAFKIFLGDEGDILLRPMANIPSKELWVHQNPDALESIQRGKRDIKKGRVTKVKNLDKFFEKL